MKRRRALAVLAFLAAAAAPARAQEGAAPADTLFLDTAVHPAIVRIGERIAVRVAVPGTAPVVELTGPPAPMTYGDVDLLESAAVAAGPDSTAWRLVVAGFRPGDLTLPAFPFRLTREGEAVTAASRPYTVTVEATVPADSAAAATLRDIRDPLVPPLRWRLWTILAALALGAAALVAGRILYRRMTRRQEIAPAAVPAVPPHVEALRDLDALQRDALPERGRTKEHYFRLSHILRVYLERRFGIPAVESTTFEIMGDLDREPRVDAGLRQRLVALLENADLVKFARFDPGVESAMAAVGKAREWVEASRARGPLPSPAGEAGASGEGGS